MEHRDEELRCSIDRPKREERRGLPETPKISKALPVIKWTEPFQEFLNRKIGNQNIPLAYIIRDIQNPPAVAPPLAPGHPHSLEHGSIEAELIARAPHSHALFRNDNSDLYFLLEEATQSTNRILSKVQKSFWSCTHVNSCQKYKLYVNLHILLNI